MYDSIKFVAAGGLLPYRPGLSDVFHRIASCDKILKGAKFTDLPAEDPTKFELRID